MDDSKPQINDWKSARTWLAIGLPVASLLAVTILSIVIINREDASDKGAAAQNVLHTVLPLVGTWVGTIIAFYFTKENFEAATRSVTDMARQLTSTEKWSSQDLVETAPA
jgi:hypothetical protein